MQIIQHITSYYMYTNDIEWGTWEVQANEIERKTAAPGKVKQTQRECERSTTSVMCVCSVLRRGSVLVRQLLLLIFKNTIRQWQCIFTLVGQLIPVNGLLSPARTHCRCAMFAPPVHSPNWNRTEWNERNERMNERAHANEPSYDYDCDCDCDVFAHLYTYLYRWFYYRISCCMHEVKNERTEKKKHCSVMYIRCVCAFVCRCAYKSYTLTHFTKFKLKKENKRNRTL